MKRIFNQYAVRWLKATIVLAILVNPAIVQANENPPVMVAYDAELYELRPASTYLGQKKWVLGFASFNEAKAAIIAAEPSYSLTQQFSLNKNVYAYSGWWKWRKLTH